jgi:four helix bundle protein
MRRSQMSEVRPQRSAAANLETDNNQAIWDEQISKESPETTRINSAKDLAVYKAAYDLAMEIFELSKCFPPEERYALTSQVRRSSRSVCLNLREAWAKRRYEAHFVSKLTDCDGENGETNSSLDFARSCQYISADEHRALVSKCAEIGRMLNGMMKKSSSFLTRD